MLIIHSYFLLMLFLVCLQVCCACARVLSTHLLNTVKHEVVA